jgi:hypothetical protein
MFKLIYKSNKRDRKTNAFKTIEFGKAPYFASYGDIQSYEWEYTNNSDYGRVSDFRRGIREYTLPVIISKTSSTNAINELHDIIDFDVINQTKGRLYYGNAYKEGWFYAGTPTEYRRSDHMIKIELKFITDDSAWIKETSYTINSKDIVVGSTTEGVNTLTDYPIDMPYDLVGKSSRIDVNISAYAYVKLVINGPATSPKVTIGDNVYEVDYAIKQGERIEIDGRKKTVKMVDINGRETNIFSFRNREHDIFAMLPDGVNIISTSGSFNLELTVIEERSVAEWI